MEELLVDDDQRRGGETLGRHGDEEEGRDDTLGGRDGTLDGRDGTSMVGMMRVLLEDRRRREWELAEERQKWEEERQRRDLEFDEERRR